MDNGYYPNQNYQPSSPHGSMRYPHYIDQAAWNAERKKISALGIAAGIAIIAYIMVGTGFSRLVSMFPYLGSETVSDLMATETMSYVVEMLYSLIAVGLPFIIMKAVMKKYYDKPIPYSKPQNSKYLLPLLVIGLAVCFVGDIFTSVAAMFSDSISQASENAAAMTSANPDNAVDMILYFLRTAIVPALIEESVMRGVIMQPLRKYGDMFAILMSALVFGLLHCNLAQIPFAFIAGIALGYIACVTESLWSSIILHAMNNTYSLIVSMLYVRYGQDSAAVMYGSSLFFYGVILAGVIVAYKYFTSDKTPRLTRSLAVNSGRNFVPIYIPGSARVSNGDLVKAYLLNVGMIAAFVAVVIETFIML